MSKSSAGSLRPLPILVYAFAGTTTAALAAYMLNLPAIHATGPVAAGILSAILILTCTRSAAATCEYPVIAGMFTGLVFAILNLVILGSVLSDLEQAEGLPSIGIMAAGWLVLCALVGTGAGFVASKLPSTKQPERLWIPRMALLTTVAALALLVIGGIVTTAQAGLAVPDWPNTFGSNMFLYPLSKMTGGIYYEHAHRLFGVLVGLMTLTLTGACLFSRQSVAVKAMSILVAIWLIGQALLGALRVDVDLANSQADTSPIDALGIVHGITGQMFVAMLGVLVALTHPLWQLPPIAVPRAKLTRRVSQLALIALLLQISLGAVLRHMDLSMHTLISHIVWSLVVVVLILLTSMRAMDAGKAGAGRLFRRLGMATMHTMILQMVLGALALWAVMTTKNEPGISTMDMLFSTAHQGIGALLLIFVTQCALWSRRIVESQKAA